MAQWVSRAQYKAIKNALTPSEKDLIAFYELKWLLNNGYVPTVEEVVVHLRKKYPNIKHTSVNYYLQRQPVIKALEARGINFRQHSQEELTPTQIAVATVMANFADERSNAEKLDSLGVNSATYYAWMNDPAFKNFVQAMADQNLKHIDPVAKTEYAKKIQEGNWNAIKHYMDVTQSVTGSDMPQSEVLIRMLIEIIQKHVRDPEIILAIANDMKLATANRSLESATLRGEVITSEDDPELEKAQRMIGFG
jgi:Helix-turn-helix of insertion element transposase